MAPLRKQLVTWRTWRTWRDRSGQKFAREIFFHGQEHSAEDGVRMGTVNKAVPHAELEKVGRQLFAGETTRLAYMTDEAQEGRDQFLEKRDPDWSPYPWYHWAGAVLLRWVAAAGSTIVVLEMVDLVVGDAVSPGGFVAVIGLVAALLLSRGGVRRLLYEPPAPS